jgi:hypothetical protein
MKNPKGCKGETKERVEQFLHRYEGNEPITSDFLVTNVEGLHKSNARQIISRLYKERILSEYRDKKGHKVRGSYSIIRNVESSIHRIEETISDAIEEQEPRQIVEPPKETRFTPEKVEAGFDWRNFKVHHIVMTLTEKSIRERKRERDILTHTIPHEQKSSLEAKMLFVPMSSYNMQTIWRNKTMQKLIRNEQNRSEIEDIDFGNNRGIKIALYGNGSVVIYIECSNNPLGILDWAEMNGFLKNLFSQRVGYSWDELKKLFLVTIAEFSVDKEMKCRKQMTTCIEVQNFEDFLYRQYERTIDGKPVIRGELVTNPNLEVGDFEKMFFTVVQGGVTEGYLRGHIHILQTNVDHLGKIVSDFIDDTKRERKRSHTRMKQIGADGSISKALYDLSDRISQSESNQKAISEALLQLAETQERTLKMLKSNKSG